jgi:hypothetical protein
VVLDSDERQFGGFGRIDHSSTFFSQVSTGDTGKPNATTFLFLSAGGFCHASWWVMFVL